MSGQPSLFDPPDPRHLARTGDPSTSHEAAQSLRAVTITKTRMAILDLIRAHPDGLTDQDIAVMLPGLASPSGLRTRRAELVDMGLVADSKRRKPSIANRRMIVWVAITPHDS